MQEKNVKDVLNLIINGIPSILKNGQQDKEISYGFKPYYKWNTFNTKVEITREMAKRLRFKPYYKWNTFNTFNKLQELGNLVQF